ncbi:MAG: hypothetical protein QN204_01425 [Armatimonadota bacterium]|nr:hypothetical protein [Armatimonadota bacterium]
MEVVERLPPGSVVLVTPPGAEDLRQAFRDYMLSRGCAIEEGGKRVTAEPPRPKDRWWQVALAPGGLQKVRQWSGQPITQRMLDSFKRFLEQVNNQLRSGRITRDQEETLRARAKANRPSAVLYSSLLAHLEGARRLGGRSGVSSPLLRECICCRKPFPPRNSRHVACERTECKRYLLRMQQLRAYERNPERYRQKARQRMARRRARR